MSQSQKKKIKNQSQKDFSERPLVSHCAPIEENIEKACPVTGTGKSPLARTHISTARADDSWDRRKSKSFCTIKGKSDQTEEAAHRTQENVTHLLEN